MPKVTDKERIVTVLERLLNLVRNDVVGSYITLDLEIFLEELYGMDVFGTEGQLDPRGDQRNGDFTMKHVEGLDT